MARLGELLVAAGLLTTEQLERALRAQVMWGARLGTNLIELGFIDLDTLSTVLAQQHKLPAALARHFEKVDRELQRSLHPDIAEMYTVLPLVRVRDNDIVLASSSPLTKKAQARIADELAVEPQQIISAIAAELRMRYQLERVYNIQRPARFMRSPGKTIPPFPAFDVDEAASDGADDDLLEVAVEGAPPAAAVPATDVSSTAPFLATYTAPPSRSPSIPPATLAHKKPVPTVDEDLSVDIDMDDSSSRVPAPAPAPAPPALAIGNLPYTTPSLPIPGVEPVVLRPRTAEARTGVTVPEPGAPAAPRPPAAPQAPSPTSSSGRIEIIVPTEHDVATVPVDKLEERDVSLESKAPVRPSEHKPEPAKPGFVKPVPSSKPSAVPDTAAKFPSLAKFDAIAEADADTEPSGGVPESVPQFVPDDAATRPAALPFLRSVPATAKADAPAKPDAPAIPRGGAIPSVVAPVSVVSLVPTDPAVTEADAAAEAARAKAEEARLRTEAAAAAARAKAEHARATQGIVPKKNQTTPGVAIPRLPAPAGDITVATPAPVVSVDATPSAVDLIAVPRVATPDTVVVTATSDGIVVPDAPAAAPERPVIPHKRARPSDESEESGAIAIPHHNLADLDTLHPEGDDELSIPHPVEDDKSSGRERRRYLRTIADAPTDSERQSQSLGRIAIRRVALAREVDEEGRTLGEATRAIRRATNRDRVADLCVDTLFRFAPSCAAASLMVVRGQVATTWKGFIRDGSPPPEIAVPLDQPSLIPKAVHRNTTVRAPSTELGPIDQLLMVSLAQRTGDMVIVPISIAKQVMCVIALVTDTDAPIATAESVAAGAGAAFARLMRDASR